MKKGLLILLGISMLTTVAFAQETPETTPEKREEKIHDTLRIGNITIIKKQGKIQAVDKTDVYSIQDENGNVIKKRKNVSTNWFAWDLGFNNFNDNTNYGAAVIQDPMGGSAPGADASWFDLRNGKSINFNLWFVQQKLNVYKHHLNLIYAFGMEIHNYRFKKPLLFIDAPYEHVALDASKTYTKNKLRTDYLTVPVMLNIDFTKKRSNNYGISAGVAVSYLMRAKQKTISDETGKNKHTIGYPMEPWRFSYVGEVNLGALKFYGTYTPQTIFKNGLDFAPYSIGLRFNSF